MNTNDELKAIVNRNFIECTQLVGMPDGAQMWDGKWWVPKYGCDGLSHLLDEEIVPLIESLDNCHLKDGLKTKEINILVKENRELIETVKELNAKISFLEQVAGVRLPAI